MKTLSPENIEHRRIQRLKAVWRPIYAWRAMPVQKPNEDSKARPEFLPFPQIHRKEFSHQPGDLLTTAPKFTGGGRVRYIVWNDHSLRKPSRKLFAMLPPESQQALLKEAA